jgi:hypothetical protein
MKRYAPTVAGLISLVRATAAIAGDEGNSTAVETRLKWRLPPQHALSDNLSDVAGWTQLQEILVDHDSVGMLCSKDK